MIKRVIRFLLSVIRESALEMWNDVANFFLWLWLKFKKSTLCSNLKRFRFWTTWFPPFIGTIVFLLNIYLPPYLTHPTFYKKSMDRSNNALSLIMRSDQRWISILQPIDLPTDTVMQLVKFPKEIGEYEYCVTNQPFVFNVDEQEIPTSDIVVLTHSTGATTQLLPRIPSCFPKKPSNVVVSGVIIEANETEKQVKEWGVRNNEENTDELSAFSKIRTEIKLKNRSLLILFPIAICALWWGLLLLYANVEKGFINKS